MLFYFSITEFKMNKHLVIVLACIAVAVAQNATTEAPAKHEHIEAAKMFWAQLTPKQQECIKEKWHKNKDELKPAFKNCHDQKGGMPCVKEIPLIKECFA